MPPVHFVLVIFGNDVSWVICSGYPWAVIHLILCSQVASITGVSLWCLVSFCLLLILNQYQPHKWVGKYFILCFVEEIL
jgi:hypothetical protein